MKDDEGVDYISRQKAMDAQYRKAFENLTPEQRAAMERGGVKGEADMTGLIGLRGSKLAVEKDAAEMAENSITASVTVDMAARVDIRKQLKRLSAAVRNIRVTKVSAPDEKPPKFAIEFGRFINLPASSFFSMLCALPVGCGSKRVLLEAGRNPAKWRLAA